MTDWEFAFGVNCLKKFEVTATVFKESLGPTLIAKVGELEFYENPLSEGVPPIIIQGEQVGSALLFDIPSLDKVLDQIKEKKRYD